MFLDLIQRIVIAADASGRCSFAPPSSSERWYVESATLIPNETSAANGSNYADLTLKRGSTALATAHSTSTTVLTQNTPVNLTLTGTPAQREITQSAPLHLLVDATPGTGVAVDVSVIVRFSVLR